MSEAMRRSVVDRKCRGRARLSARQVVPLTGLVRRFTTRQVVCCPT
jgi:hypothetical protein